MSDPGRHGLSVFVQADEWGGGAARFLFRQCIARLSMERVVRIDTGSENLTKTPRDRTRPCMNNVALARTGLGKPCHVFLCPRLDVLHFIRHKDMVFVQCRM